MNFKIFHSVDFEKIDILRQKSIFSIYFPFPSDYYAIGQHGCIKSTGVLIRDIHMMCISRFAAPDTDYSPGKSIFSVNPDHFSTISNFTQ